MVIKHQPGIEPVLAALDAAVSPGAPAYLVGGYVRDRVLERDCKDVDIVVVVGDAGALAEAVAKRLGAGAPAIFERFGTAQVKHADFVVEFVAARAESYAADSRKPDVRPATLEEDILRRDFTCNTLLATTAGEVLDVTGHGLQDIAERLLRTPKPAAETFAEDPLRAIRAVRFAVTLGFRLDEEIPAAIRSVVDKLGSVVSIERINDELRKMLLADGAADAMRMLRDTGVLDHLMPQVVAMGGVEQSGFHDRDVLEHSLAALEHVARRPQPHLDGKAELALRLGILLHDVGKPATAARDGDRVTFLGHPEVGAAAAEALLRRLAFSNDEVAAVARLVRTHMRPIQYQPEEWSDGAVRRLVRDSGDVLPGLLLLARADMAASSYPAAEAERKLGDLERRIGDMDVEAVRRTRPPLDGEWLMARLGRRPGPWIGRVHAALLEAVLDGEIPDGAEAEAWAWLEGHPELLDERA